MVKRCIPVAAVAIALILFAFPAAAGAAEWSPTQVTLPAGATEGTLESVSCPAAGSCVATGLSAPDAIVATETAGSWGQATAIAPPSLPDAALYGVSCPAVGECVAVGAQYQLGNGVKQAIAVTETAGVWGAVIPIGAPAGVTNAMLFGVSCPAVGDCVAVGGGEGGLVAVADSGGTWEPAVAIAAPPGGFGGSWLVNVPELRSVSCTAPGSCVAVGDWEKSTAARSLLPMYATETGGTWSQAVGLEPPAGATEGRLESISCAGPASCAAAGFSPEAGLGVTETDGTWTLTPIASAPGSASAILFGISCPGAGSCTAVGDEGPSTFGRPLAASYVDGSWSEATSIVPVGGSPKVPLYAVSCPGTGPCVAAGASEGRPIVYTGEGAEAGQGGGSSSVQVTTIDSPGGGGAAAACSISLASTSIQVDRAHTAQVGLTDNGGAACDGTVALSVKAKAKGKGAKGKRKKPKVRVIGRGSVKLAPGTTATVSVRLNGAGKTALAKAAGPLKASLAVHAGGVQIVDGVQLHATKSKQQHGKGSGPQ